MNARQSSTASSSASASSARNSFEVSQARFETSAPDLKRCPHDGLPEFAVAGRSNVGKSSLLNTFAGVGGLARVSRTPGRTRLLNAFRMRLSPPKKATAEGGSDAAMEIRWVDLPGYGFARAARKERDAFEPMIEGYLRGRADLRALLVLIDARRGPTDADIELLTFTSQISLPCLVCATKCDKLGASERGVLGQRFAKELGVHPSDILLTSASSGLGLRVGKKGDLARELFRLGQQAARWDEALDDASSDEGEDPKGSL